MCDPENLTSRSLVPRLCLGNEATRPPARISGVVQSECDRSGELGEPGRLGQDTDSAELSWLGCLTSILADLLEGIDIGVRQVNFPFCQVEENMAASCSS